MFATPQLLIFDPLGASGGAVITILPPIVFDRVSYAYLLFDRMDYESEATAMAFSDDPITVGSTPQFQHQALKNGVAWTGATVSLLFRKPDGTVVGPLSAPETSTPGFYAYNSQGSDFQTAGFWDRAWQVSQGGVAMTSLPWQFAVIASP